MAVGLTSFWACFYFIYYCSFCDITKVLTLSTLWLAHGSNAQALPSTKWIVTQGSPLGHIVPYGIFSFFFLSRSPQYCFCQVQLMAEPSSSSSLVYRYQSHQTNPRLHLASCLPCYPKTSSGQGVFFVSPLHRLSSFSSSHNQNHWKSLRVKLKQS